MDQGVIAETGSYEQLMGHNGAFAKFMKTYLTEHNSDSDSDEEGTKLSMTLLFILLSHENLTLMHATNNAAIQFTQMHSPISKFAIHFQKNIMVKFTMCRVSIFQLDSAYQQNGLSSLLTHCVKAITIRFSFYKPCHMIFGTRQDN